MTDTKASPIPDPEEQWCDTLQAAALLNRSRATVYDMALRGLLTQRYVGRATLYWRPEVLEIAAALKRLGGQ